MEAKGSQYIIHPSRADEFTIWNLSDLHYGNKGCAIDKLHEDILRIRSDPRAFWLGGGDYAEFIGLTDRRFDPDAVAEQLTVADMGRLGHVLMQRVKEMLWPIRHKCLGLLMGNHERQYMVSKDQLDLHGWLCTELEVPNLEYSALMDVVFVRRPTKAPMLTRLAPRRGDNTSEVFRFFVAHGAGYAATPAGKLKRLIDFMTNIEADVYMVGHVHDQSGRRQVRIAANGGCTKLIQREAVGVISGSYLKTYAQGVTTYGEQKGYAPTTLGASFVRIRPDKRQVTGEI